MESLKHPVLDGNFSVSKKGKIVTADEAVKLIGNGDAVAFSGFLGIGGAEEVIIALRKRFDETGEPKTITLIYAASLGDGKEKGFNRLAVEGLLKRVVGGHWGLTPKLAELVKAGKAEGYNLPLGTLSMLFRDMAARRPRLVTSVGLGTFVDPRNGGGKMNSVTTEDLVEVVHFDGREYLAYRTMAVNVAVIRGTTADADGNITMEREALTLDALSVAMAAKNSGGIVIAQVERLAENGALPMRAVKVPGIFVDCVCVAKPENHMQTGRTQYSPAFAGEFRIPLSMMPPLPLDERKIITRRAAFELIPNSIVNLGIGMPEGVSSVAAEEGVLDKIHLTAEPGVVGGMPASGLDFGAACNVSAIVDMPYQFDFYDGGGLDIAILGMAQADRVGNVNVSRFGSKIAGAGGFINISQNAKKVIFLGTFTAGGLDLLVKDGQLAIRTEGRSRKFVEKVEQITFSGEVAARNGKDVLYITERCVFKMTGEGPELIEIAPGIDLEKDIIAQMEFRPRIVKRLKLMDGRIFGKEIMKLKEVLLSVPLENRLSYEASGNFFFVDFEGLTIRTVEEIERIRNVTEEKLRPLGKKVKAIVNYDGFDILPELVIEYVDMLQEVVRTYYTDVTRYSSYAFTRMKKGESLGKKATAAHVFETREEAGTRPGGKGDR